MRLETNLELYKKLHDKIRLDCEKSLFAFFSAAWPTLEHRFDFDNNWHIGLACEYLEAVYAGEIEKLVINWPTRYLKTKICSIAFPAWCWTQDAKKKFINWSYSGELSSSISWERRLLVESDWYQGYWGKKIKLMPDQNQKTRYANTRGGSMFSTSTGGTLTGEGCDIQIIDDPVNPQDAANDLLRLKANEFWSGTASSRFDDKKKKSCVLVMQRLHERDLTGYFLSEYPEVVHLKIPTRAPERIIYSYPRSGRVKIYEADEILQPNREGEKELEQAKRELGSYNFASQRMQEPVPRGGGIIKEAWFKFYREAPGAYDFITLSIDCSFKDLESSDYVVLQAWGQVGTNHYLLKQLRAKLSFLKTKDALVQWTKYFPTYYEALIEDKANGTAIINALAGSVRALVPIVPKESKVARLVACEPEIEAGAIFLPDPDLNPWVREVFIPEVTAFPKAANDDQVDAMSQYLNRVRVRKVGSFSLDSDEFSNLSGSTIAESLS
jgi:predicted phage terminase large subunit-like protein